ncbi:hypothetical protein GCM10028895_40330 [Pontibacter rugosus]
MLIDMLEYIKTILLKVSFDKMLFEKELRKAFKVLKRAELKQLRNWCYEQFSGMYLLILNRVFLKPKKV